jgi:hypothetical protein
LATKALEYKFVKVLDGVDMGPLGSLDYNDVFKCQTTADFDKYLKKLKAYNVFDCTGGEFQLHTPRISVVHDILGLTKENEDERYRRFQQFINEHIDENGDLSFTFTTSYSDNNLRQLKNANLKIWYGTIPCNDDISGKGLTASLFFRGAPGALYPWINIQQKGIQSFLRKDKKPVNYYPVKTYALLTSNDSNPEPFTEASFRTFVGVDPRSETNLLGRWTNAFTNRGIAATEWIVTLQRNPGESGDYDPIPFNKLTDICFYFNIIGNNFEQ